MYEIWDELMNEKTAHTNKTASAVYYAASSQRLSSKRRSHLSHGRQRAAQQAKKGRYPKAIRSMPQVPPPNMPLTYAAKAAKEVLA